MVKFDQLTSVGFAVELGDNRWVQFCYVPLMTIKLYFVSLSSYFEFSDTIILLPFIAFILNH